MTGRLFFGLILAAALLATSTYPVGAGQAVVDEVNLASSSAYAVPSQQPTEINLGGNGNLIVSDFGVGLLWDINPVTGAFTLYDFDNNGLVDAHQGPNGAYWFTNNTDEIYYVDHSHLIYYGWKPQFADTYIQLGALAVTAQNTIWLADYYGVENGFYRLTNTAGEAEFCVLIPDSGAYNTNTNDLLFKDGYLWAFNFQLKQVLRLNTVAQEGKYSLDIWQTPIPDVGEATLEGWTMDFDDQGDLWIGGSFQSINVDPDVINGFIYRFNPQNKTFSAYANPVTDTDIYGVTALKGKVWFQNYVGLVGEMDPAVLTPFYSAPIPEADHQTMQLSTNCQTEESTVPLSPGLVKQGTLPFVEKNYPVDTSHPGWIHYIMPASYTHWGINHAQDTVIVTGKDMLGTVPYLLRFTPETTNQYFVFLPLIKK